MIAQARSLNRIPTLLHYLVFAIGVLVLLATGFVLYGWTSLGTEALLVPWQCDCTWDTRPAVGTVPRALNDFFAASGRDLPSLVFILVTGAIVAIRTWRAKHRTWLPLLFSMASIVFLAADVVATVLTGSLSDWVVGPRAGVIDAAIFNFRGDDGGGRSKIRNGIYNRQAAGAV